MEAKTIVKNTSKSKLKDAKFTEPKGLSSAWAGFAERLTLVLQRMEEDQFLILRKKNTNEFVQFSAQGFYGLRVETTSNWYRNQNNQLTPDQISTLVGLGWNAPSKNPENSTPESDPDGSPNYYREFPFPLQYEEVVGMVIYIFIEVLNVQHPGFLEYEAFGSDQNSLVFLQLGLKRAIADDAGEQNSKLSQLLLATVVELTGITDWAYDEVGDLGGIRYGNAVTYVRLADDRPYIHIHSTVLRDVEETHALYVRVNELNRKNGHMHLIIREGAVIAFSDVLVTPFVASIVAHGLGNFCQIADELVDILKVEFGDDTTTLEQHTTQVVH